MGFLYFLERFLKGILYFFVFIVFVCLAVLPLSPNTLDLWFIAELLFSVFLLFIACYAYRRTNLYIFPFLLGLGALYHLGFMIASTRTILLYANPGNIIHDSGAFLIGGSFIGASIICGIFAILIFAVIWRVLSRTLKRIPSEWVEQGKIEEEKRHSGEENQEPSFSRKNQFARKMAFGLRFLQANALLAFFFILLQFLGGVWIATSFMGMENQEAIKTYWFLITGSYFVYQIPTLLYALAAFILISRVFEKKVTVD